MQGIVVWIVVIVAALYVGRRYYRTLSGKTQGCDCDASCDSCPRQPDGSHSCGQPRQEDKPDQG